jgi:hypothetical protein
LIENPLQNNPNRIDLSPLIKNPLFNEELAFSESFSNDGNFSSSKSFIDLTQDLHIKFDESLKKISKYEKNSNVC